MTPFSSVAILEKLALLKIAFCKAPVFSRASSRRTSVMTSTVPAPSAEIARSSDCAGTQVMAPPSFAATRAALTDPFAIYGFPFECRLAAQLPGIIRARVMPTRSSGYTREIRASLCRHTQRIGADAIYDQIRSELNGALSRMRLPSGSRWATGVCSEYVDPAPVGLRVGGLARGAAGPQGFARAGPRPGEGFH